MENNEITQTNEEYGASDIQVLEGLEGGPEASGHVYRFHRAKACTIWYMRSLTTPLTRPWPATAIKSM
mgnify:CR=1 FL=1